MNPFPTSDVTSREEEIEDKRNLIPSFSDELEEGQEEREKNPFKSSDSSNSPENETKEDRERRREEVLKDFDKKEELRRNPPSTSSTSLVGEDQFEWKGFTYKLGPISFKIEGRFEQWCETNELLGIERRAGQVSDYTYAVLMNAYLDRLGMRHWSWKGFACAQARRNPDGLKYLAFLILIFYNPPESCIDKPVWTEKEIENLWDNEFKWKEFQVKIRRLTDPNPTAPNPPAAK